jgi:hypothetical protein
MKEKLIYLDQYKKEKGSMPESVDINMDDDDEIKTARLGEDEDDFDIDIELPQENKFEPAADDEKLEIDLERVQKYASKNEIKVLRQRINNEDGKPGKIIKKAA